MGKRKDRAIIFEAADNWHDEIVDEILPRLLTEDERESYTKQEKRLRGALIREQSRLEAKRTMKRTRQQANVFLGLEPQTPLRAPGNTPPVDQSSPYERTEQLETTTQVTEYAAIHPGFPVNSLAHAWTESRDEAVGWATAMSKELGKPVRVESRLTTIRREYFADSICS